MHRENGLKPILTDACTVIVDEAHKLPERAREMFGTTLTAGEIRSAVVRLKQDGDVYKRQPPENLTELKSPCA